MRRPSTTTAFELLKQGPAAKLLARARSLADLQRLVRRLLPEPLGAHCTVLNLHNGSLSLATDSPVWAARLRFLAPRLVKQLECQKSCQVRAVRVSVLPPASPRDQAPPRRAGLSAEAGTLLEHTADAIEHEPLRTALRRLAAHGHRS